MTFSEYQQRASATAIFPREYAVMYPALGLAGEAGELCNKLKKRLRDGEQSIPIEHIAKEIGDVLWYAAMVASDLGLSLEEIAEANLAQLADRQARGVLHGSGDHR